MDYELIWWIVAGIVGVIGFGILWAMAKEESKNYVDPSKFKDAGNRKDVDGWL